MVDAEKIRKQFSGPAFAIFYRETGLLSSIQSNPCTDKTISRNKYVLPVVWLDESELRRLREVEDRVKAWAVLVDANNDADGADEDVQTAAVAAYHALRSALEKTS